MSDKYELTCIFDPKTAEDRIEATLNRIEKKITASGGTMDNVNKMGTRKLLMKMSKNKTLRDGLFVMILFSGPSNVPNDVTALVRVSEDVIRFMLTKAPEKIEAPEEKAAETAVEVNPEMLVGKPE